MYAVKIEYDTATSSRTGTKVLVYEELREAIAMFNGMVIAYQFVKPVRDKSGRTVEIVGAWLFETAADTVDDAISMVESGTAVLIDEASGIDLGLGDE